MLYKKGENMKALLCSSFRYMGNFFVPYLEMENKRKLTILFVDYALPDEQYSNQNKEKLKSTFNVGKIIDLQPDYDFKDNIDIIFVNGGLTDVLIEKLYKYNQFKTIERLVFDKGILYIGESAGSDFAGDYIHYDLYVGFKRNYNMIEKYGDKVFEGLRIINKMIVTHACEYRVRISEDGEYYRSPYSYEQCNDYSKTIEILKNNNIAYETIGNNEALLVNGKTYKKIIYDWSKFPIRELELTEHEKKLKSKVQESM